MPKFNHTVELQDGRGYWFKKRRTALIISRIAASTTKRYYFDSDGYAVTGWRQISGKSGITLILKMQTGWSKPKWSLVLPCIRQRPIYRRSA